MALTQESLLSFLLERGGKVKNSELVNNFKSQINCSDPAEKQLNRELFKKLVNSVAVVRQVDDVKFVVVKKRYQDFVKDDASQKTQMDDSFSSQNTSFSYSSPRRPGSKMLRADIENNNTCFPSHANGGYYTDAKHTPAGSPQKEKPLSRKVSSVDTTTVKVLNISGDQASRSGKSGAVFAVIAVKSPPRVSAPVTQGGLHSQRPLHEASEKPTTPSVPNLNSYFPVCVKDAPGDSQSWKNRQTDDMQHPGFPQGRPQNKTTRQGDDAKYSESVPLEPSAHEWLVKCAAGLWGQIYALLLQDTRLAQKKDFMSGFTALHWAAKDGNSEMIHKLMDVSKSRGAYIDVNVKAHGGYTPLHIAAVHGRAEAMLVLVRGYEANVNERDNDGKKACHYLGEGASDEVRALLGGLKNNNNNNKCREKTECEEDREQLKGFNTISKLFQPHTAKKQKPTTKFAHDW